MRDRGGRRKGDRRHGGFLRGCGAALLCGLALGHAVPAAAQDTPEMLEAMRSHLPPVPALVPTREQLPDAVRAALPAFRLDVHRWHADPAERYVSIDGRRVGEDGVVGRELWLRRIDPDGVVLQFRDSFFFQRLAPSG